MLWQSNGKPKFGPILNLMQVTRARFKQCLRYCKNIESVARADSLARKYMSKDPKLFGKEIKCINKNSNPVSNSINGISGDNQIVDMWKTHYSDILNCNSDEKNKHHVTNFTSSISPQTNLLRITPDNVKDATLSMKMGKSAGLDKLRAENLIFAGGRLIVLLSILFNLILIHGCVPTGLMETVIVPIIKDKKKSISDKDNYRPIAITSVISKVLENIILSYSSDNLHTTDNQFGFKPKLGTEMCVFAFKQVIDYYKSNSSPVYICYLDASKAFDRVNHWTLLSKLINRNINVLIIRLLQCWYRQQAFCIRWGTSLSTKFYVSNGVRQGGIMSPILFNVYMDNLSMELNKSGIGCVINDSPVNHLMYADDMCILAPSVTGLQNLLNISAEYAQMNTIIFNESKSKCMCIKPKNMSELYVPNVKLNHKNLVWVQLYKYLGVMMDSSCKDDTDIKRHIRGVYTRGNLIVNRFRNCSDDVKTRLFKTYCNSIYGGALWNNYTKPCYRKAKVAYNDIYRALFHIARGVSMSNIYVTKGIDCFNVLARKLVYSLWQRLSKSSNSIISTIFHCDHCLRHSLIVKKWKSLLHVHPDAST